MKGKILICLIMLTFVLTPTLLYAQTEAGKEAKPPVSQALVREGSFAVELAVALNVGKPANESEAESLLVKVGVAPHNGWIADYPVTPDIAGELQASVSEAAVAGRLNMGKDAALAAFQNILAEYNLPLSATISVRSAGEVSSANPGTEVINNYYYEEGPPVVTYYAPPPDYAYLYGWVPYPFWWADWWFPGFFVLTDFAVFEGFEGHHHHHHGHEHGEFVSNHFRDSRTGTTGRIDPATRASGRGFISGSGSGSRWSSPSAQRGANAIFSRSLTAGNGFGRSVSSASYNRMMGSTTGNRQFMSSSGSQRASNNGSQMRANTGRSSFSGRGTFRGSQAPRVYNGSGFYGGRTTYSRGYGSFGSAGAGSRSYSAPSGGNRSSGYSGGGFSRGSFSGGGRGFSGGGHGGGRGR